jgi:HEAT repeat protein
MRVVLALSALAVAVGACKGKVSEADVERWKAAERPGQIAEVMGARDIDAPVRLRAAQALVELASDAHFAAALRRLDSATRAALARDLGPELDRLFAAPELAKQVLAKDFLGQLILAGDRYTAERVGPAIVRWLSADFNGRVALGRVSAIVLLKQIGTPALPVLHTQIRPENDLLRIAKVVSEIGDRAGIRHAADLVRRVAESQAPDVPLRTLRAIFTLGGAQAARHLVAIAGDDRYSLKTRRLAAEEMRALGHRAALPTASRLGLDPREDLYVRESCLVYLEKTCDGSCAPYLPGLWRILHERGLRFEAASAIVKIGGAEALPRLLWSLPPGTYGEKGISGLARDIRANIGARALPALRVALGQRPWPGRILAIRALALLGEDEDALRLERVRGDARRPPGWKVGTSIGAEAVRAAQQIRARKRTGG